MRALLAISMPVLLALGCASVEQDGPAADTDADGTADWAIDTVWDSLDATDAVDLPVESPEDLPVDTLADPPFDVPVDPSSDIADVPTDSLPWDTFDPDPDPDPLPDPDADPDPDPDTAPDGPASCAGTLVGGYCWYLGTSENSCDAACSSHGGYSEATRTYAGSGGSNSSCESVLTALGVSYPGVSTLGGSGEGVGCFFMTMVNSRYRVADTPTASNATYLLSRRACACNL